MNWGWFWIVAIVQVASTFWLETFRPLWWRRIEAELTYIDWVWTSLLYASMALWFAMGGYFGWSFFVLSGISVGYVLVAAYRGET